MLDKLKGILEIVFKYLSETSTFRKVIDGIFVCMMIVMIMILMITAGVVMGKVPLKLPAFNQPQNIVEIAVTDAREVQKILDVAQVNNQFALIASYKYHNGEQSFDGQHLVKWTIGEFSSAPTTIINTIEEKQVPMTSNLKMVDAHIHGQCYQGTPSADLYNYISLVKSGINSYTSCPIYARDKNLVGFVYIGSTSSTPPSIDITKNLADQIGIYQRMRK